MRPNEFYALPSLEAEPWYDAYGVLEALFRDDGIEAELDRSGARDAGSASLALDRKLHVEAEGGRTVTYHAAVFEGRPFAVVVTAGRGGAERRIRAITDMGAFRAARAYVDLWRGRDAEERREFVDPDADLDVLAGTYGYAVVREGGGARLVRAGEDEGGGAAP